MERRAPATSAAATGAQTVISAAPEIYGIGYDLYHKSGGAAGGQTSSSRAPDQASEVATFLRTPKADRAGVGAGGAAEHVVVLEDLYDEHARAGVPFYDGLAREVYGEALSYGCVSYADAVCAEARRRRGVVVGFLTAAAADAAASAFSGRVFDGRRVVVSRRTESLPPTAPKRNILDGRDCGICLGPQSDTLLLRCCAYTACRACLVTWARNARRDDRAPTCPNCRADLEDVRILSNIRSDEDFVASSLEDLLND